jgi:hypothetical protein
VRRLFSLQRAAEGVHAQLFRHRGDRLQLLRKTKGTRPAFTPKPAEVGCEPSAHVRGGARSDVQRDAQEKPSARRGVRPDGTRFAAPTRVAVARETHGACGTPPNPGSGGCVIRPSARRETRPRACERADVAVKAHRCHQENVQEVLPHRRCPVEDGIEENGVALVLNEGAQLPPQPVARPHRPLDG